MASSRTTCYLLHLSDFIWAIVLEEESSILNVLLFSSTWEKYFHFSRKHQKVGGKTISPKELKIIFFVIGNIGLTPEDII